MNIDAVAYFLTSIVVPLQGIFVFWKNPRKSLNQIWCSLSVLVGLWSLSNALMVSSTEYLPALRWARLLEAHACFIAAMFLHFVYTLLQRTKRLHTISIYYLIAGLFALLTLCTSLIVDTVRPKASFTYYTHYGSLAWLYIMFFLFVVIIAHKELWLGIRSARGTERNRLLYVFSAGLLGFGMGSSGFLTGYDLPVKDVGSLTFLYAFPITYAILKYQLMDITFVIRRTLVYSALTALLTAGYFLFILITERWFQALVGYNSFLITAGAAFLLAISFIPMKNRIQTTVDRLFFKGSLPQLAEEQRRLRAHLREADQQKAVSIFAAGMAHEIKNPLATLQTFAEHLPNKYGDPTFRERFARLIPQEVAKIDRIVREVLAVARPAPPQLQTATLRQVVEEVLELLSDRLVNQRVRVVRAYGIDGACRIDTVQVKQALLNLILNSLEAMPEGGTLTIGLARANGHLNLSLQDTGCGIAPDLLPQLGTPFVTTKLGGTGLGVAIVQGILEAHGGRITFQSRPGAGTTVMVRLPEAQMTDARLQTIDEQPNAEGL